MLISAQQLRVGITPTLKVEPQIPLREVVLLHEHVDTALVDKVSWDIYPSKVLDA